MSAKNIIKEAKRQLGNISQLKFAEITGFDIDRVKNLESGRVGKFTDEEIEILVKFTTLKGQEILISQIAGDNWDRYDKQEEGNIPTHLAKRVTENAVPNGIQSLNSPDLIPVPIISAVAGMALEGIEHFEVETSGQLLIDQMMFKVLPNLKNIQALRVDGNSMLPTLKPDDYVILELGDVFNGEGIYALQWDSMLFVKRLQASEQRGVIDIISDNQSFPVKQFNPKDDQRAFNIIGKVILRIQR
jgi:phage repressor protein C with HTH and peptisase S24 domain